MSGNSSGKGRVLSGKDSVLSNIDTASTNKDTVSTSKDSVLRGNVRALSGKESVLFVCTTLSSFVKGDIEILQGRYRVKVLQVPPGSRFKQFFSILREFLHLLFKIKRYR
ncbi:MAG: hypothetical protein M0P27_08930, partial [Bacteroidales bacterium]|nr:hypothetical protein [Bacteroidales bacterium]